STLPVTVDYFAYHTASVASTTEKALIFADLPFMYYSTPEQTYNNAATLMRSVANMVKLECGTWLSSSIAGLIERG
ncbi:3-methyl-2-oxobutanoate hydroxymethyltransferase, partial [Psychromonas aquatilis]